MGLRRAGRADIRRGGVSQVAPSEIGFVGLGNMGMAMARRLPAAGYQVVGYDASAEIMRDIAGLDGFTPAPGITGLGTDVVMLCLPDSDVVEHVLLAEGLLDSVPAGGMVIDMSSSDPARTRALAARADEVDVTLIDAPVSGGVSGARAGTLTDHGRRAAGGVRPGPADAGGHREAGPARGRRRGRARGQGAEQPDVRDAPDRQLRGADRRAAVRARPGGRARDHQRLQRPQRLDREQVAQLRAHREVRRRVRSG